MWAMARLSPHLHRIGGATAQKTSPACDSGCACFVAIRDTHHTGKLDSGRTPKNRWGTVQHDPYRGRLVGSPYESRMIARTPVNHGEHFNGYHHDNCPACTGESKAAFPFRHLHVDSGYCTQSTRYCAVNGLDCGLNDLLPVRCGIETGRRLGAERRVHLAEFV